MRFIKKTVTSCEDCPYCDKYGYCKELKDVTICDEDNKIHSECPLPVVPQVSNFYEKEEVLKLLWDLPLPTVIWCINQFQLGLGKLKFKMSMKDLTDEMEDW